MEAEENKIVKQLKDDEQDKLKALGPKKTAKLMHKMLKAYNRLCPKCKRKAFINSRRPMEDYCNRCQDILKKALKEAVE